MLHLFVSWVYYGGLCFLIVRTLQRMYYVLKGHQHYYSYFPRDELHKFLKEKGIRFTQHKLFTTKGDITLRYSRLGSGTRFILLANGVGTDFFMWLPMLRFIVDLDRDFFSKYTIIVQSYRGLFHPNDSDFGIDTPITVTNCVSDIRDMMKHAGVKQYDTILGWSTGAQVALACCAKHPTTSAKLFLFNPSTGRTLHYVLQAVMPFPSPVRRIISHIVVGGISMLKPFIVTKVWDFLKRVAYSTGFRWFLEVLAFTGGFPPEQPVYFHEYMRDVFKTRTQTRSLLDLILSLDETLPAEALTLPHRTYLLSGFPDFITGVYHSQQLDDAMENSKHISFTMGSHFLLIEWPELVAKYFVEFINST